MSKGKVYICGPMAGYPDMNIVKFREAAGLLNNEGYKTIVPHDVNPDAPSFESAMKSDLKAMIDCDYVAVLEGAIASRGGQIEIDLAHKLGIPVRVLQVFVGGDQKPFAFASHGVPEFCDETQARDKANDAKNMTDGGFNIMRAIMAEKERAEKKFPEWPSNLVEQVAIMAEEAGEAVKAANEAHHEGKSLEEVQKELVQTGAMVIRALEHIN